MGRFYLAAGVVAGGKPPHDVEIRLSFELAGWGPPPLSFWSLPTLWRTNPSGSARYRSG